MDSFAELNFDRSPVVDYYMPRPRLDRVFEKAFRCKLIYVIAGTGYGKTQAVYHYIREQQDAIVRWIQLAESDNIGPRYWENLARTVSVDNPDLGAKIRDLGFPETFAHFKQFAEIHKTTEHRSHQTFLVLDDFHLIHSEQMLTFVERCAHLQIPEVCVVMISRKEPEVNIVSLFSKGKAYTITEDDLRFTEDEIAQLYKLRHIPLAKKHIPQLFNATKGWGLAISLLSLALAKAPKNLDHALAVMKRNIFELMETEAFYDFSENVKKNMVQLSLVSDLPLTHQHGFIDTESLRNVPSLASFMWFDNFIGDYRIQPLYLEFLQSKHAILSDSEKRDTYRQAAEWCFENGLFLDAVNYYAKSGQYERIVETLLSYPFKLPYETCKYFLNILKDIDPENKEKDNFSILLLKNFFAVIFLIGMDRFDEARELSYDIVRKWEHSESPFSSTMLCLVYSNLSYISMYTCTVTHKYDSSAYLKMSVDYYKISSVPMTRTTGAFGVADVRSFACLVGDGADLSEFDEFIICTGEAASYIDETFHNMYYGYVDLAACELAYFKNQLVSAKNHAHNAILKAREKKQYSIEAMAKHYLLRIVVLEGNVSLTKELLSQLGKDKDNPDFWNSQLLFDLFTGSLYSLIGLPDMVPLWLVGSEESTPEIHIPARELLVSAGYYIASRKYLQALTILCNSHPRLPQERFFFSELMLTLLLAVARFNTGDVAGAINDFEIAYHASFYGEFEMPFIELGKQLHPLVSAALKHSDCDIPEKWLKTIDRKASISAKRTAIVADALKREKNIKNTIKLSSREQDVLLDLYHGLSREEIAINRYLSINTVKKILQSIYIKLNANNNVDAIRIAIKKKLIE
ncbi:MAG: LuxR C-terminal-related transcriptional regulator [Oscillospiraceae bacterium]|jgi:LuxR family maltose regulon positive regulatory protein|nr:LuxR C-terminal-related transcriptional regulator [Oscillospiraceae bacterium]